MRRQPVIALVPVGVLDGALAALQVAVECVTEGPPEVFHGQGTAGGTRPRG